MENSNKIVIKNTFLLYIRLLVTLGVSLYSTRLILDALGASDYGLYNVVGGCVAMLSFLNGAMSNASQRFITYALGKGDKTNVGKIFSQIKYLHCLIALLVILLSETVGLWFVNFKLNIEPNRLVAANWVFQCSILSMALTIISVPYNAMLIANENMKIFALVGMIESIFKLVISVFITLIAYEGLIIYSILLAVLAFFIRLYYNIYCKKNYGEYISKNKFEIKMIREIGSFAVWSLFGSISTLANSQGINIIINLFFGTVVNAARGISYQIDNVLKNFVTNFQTAINPQIVKEYAAKNLNRMHELIYIGSKISFFCLFLLAIPVFVNIDYILNLWLIEVPEYTVEFVRLILLNSLIVTFSGPLSMAAQATGNIRNYQIFMGSFLLLNLPIAYILYTLHFPPYYAIIVSIIIEFFLLFMRLAFLKKMIKLSYYDYLCKVIKPSIFVVMFSFPLIFFLDLILQIHNVLDFLLSCIIIISISSFAVYFFGLSINERNKLRIIVNNRINKYKRQN